MPYKTKLCGIYLITCVPTGRRYVGQSCDIRSRWYGHKHNLKANKNHNVILQSSWNKYGEACFEFSILELCQKEDLNSRERYWIDALSTWASVGGMNISREHYEGSRDTPMSSQTLAKQKKYREEVWTKKYFAFGSIKTLQEWSDHTGLSKECIRARLRRGMPLEEALSKSNDKFKILTVAGEIGTIRQLSEKFKIKQNVVVNRIYMKWCPTKALLLPLQRLAA